MSFTLAFMNLGIDFGTNRIVVAAADRGNYPLVQFDTGDGTTADWYPSLIAINGTEQRFGWDAWNAQADPDWTVLRSVKRLLDKAGPGTPIDFGAGEATVFELLTGLTSALAMSLRQSSNLQMPPDGSLCAVLGVPAHANSNQRFLTVEAFRAAGFDVLGILNEPSAASIEFGHRQRQSRAGRETILVYDLGGGTFDASLVVMDEKVHHVRESDGIASIGGDDFDQLLAEMALEAAGLSADEADRIPPAATFRLLEECRLKKEALHPNSRRMTVELDAIEESWPRVEIPVAAFYERARPMVEETLAVAEELIGKIPSGEFEALYITGGGSELPLIARILRERFGRRVRRSAYTRSATAIGLAIQADQPGVYQLSERLGRYFGVWREGDGGRSIIFDPLFEKGQSLPAAGGHALTRQRSYHPAHNIGHFRFLECSHRNPDGTPSGEVTLWDDIRFPFDATLQSDHQLYQMPVHATDGLHDTSIEECYQCDAGGVITATLTNRSAGYSRQYQLGRWSARSETTKPVKLNEIAKPGVVTGKSARSAASRN